MKKSLLSALMLGTSLFIAAPQASAEMPEKPASIAAGKGFVINLKSQGCTEDQISRYLGGHMGMGPGFVKKAGAYVVQGNPENCPIAVEGVPGAEVAKPAAVEVKKKTKAAKKAAKKTKSKRSPAEIKDLKALSAFLKTRKKAMKPTDKNIAKLRKLKSLNGLKTLSDAQIKKMLDVTNKRRAKTK